MSALAPPQPAANLAAVATAQLLTREQAALYLGIRPQTLSVWATTGRYALPRIRVGRCVRYRRDHLDQWLESRTIRPGD